ncbi:Twinfilin-1, partial [Dipsacomyces acuminosporus]
FSLTEEVLGKGATTPAAQVSQPDTATATTNAATAAPQKQNEQPVQWSKAQTQAATQRSVTTQVQVQTCTSQLVGSGQGGVFIKKLDPRLAMSKSELEHVDLLRQEDDARNEQLQQMRTHFRNYTTPSRPDINPNNQHANDRGIKQTMAAASGGFHTVSLPLSPGAKAALNNFAADDSSSAVELQIESNKSVTEVRSYTGADGFSPSSSEPRFYVLRVPAGCVFAYCCPEGSAPRLRMVYSTAAASTLAQIQELGCQITHKLSVFSAKECTLAAVASSVRSGQAQRVDMDKPVDAVVNYVPSKPAKSLPSRFASNTTKALDAFTDEDGFRKAFSGVRPDAPAPAPFKASTPTRSFSSVSSNQLDNGVDTSPNTGAAAWGVQLKSSAKTSVSRAQFSAADVKDQFSNIRLAGETGNDTSAGSTSSSGLVTPSAVIKSETAASPEIVHSSLPGLRHVPNTHNPAAAAAEASSSAASPSAQGDKWDPWRPLLSLALLFGASAAAPISIYIPGIFNMDLSRPGGLHINVLSGLVTANVPLEPHRSRPKVTALLPINLPTATTTVIATPFLKIH